MASLIDKLDKNTIIFSLATAIGIYGGFPQVPKVVSKNFENPFVQYVMLVVLIYQGGAGGQLDVAMAMAALFFAMNQYLLGMEG